MVKLHASWMLDTVRYDCTADPISTLHISSLLILSSIDTFYFSKLNVLSFVPHCPFSFPGYAITKIGPLF